MGLHAVVSLSATSVRLRQWHKWFWRRPPLRLQHCPRLQDSPYWAFTCRGFFFLLLDGCFPETFSDCGFSSGLPWARAQNCFKLWPEISIFIKDFPLLESIALATAIGLRVLKPIAMATAIDLPWPRQSISAPLDRLPWLRQSIPTMKNRFRHPTIDGCGHGNRFQQ